MLPYQKPKSFCEIFVRFFAQNRILVAVDLNHLKYKPRKRTILPSFLNFNDEFQFSL